MHEWRIRRRPSIPDHVLCYTIGVTTQLGSLIFEPTKEHGALLAPTVALALVRLPGAEAIGVAEIDPAVSDTAGFCERYGIGPEQAANCIVVEAVRGSERILAACVILASTRADINGKVRQCLDMKKVSFAQMEKAMSATGMAFGTITPIGLPSSWRILVDAAVTRAQWVIIGSGVRHSKLAVPGSFLVGLPNVSVVEGLAHPRD